MPEFVPKWNDVRAQVEGCPGWLHCKIEENKFVGRLNPGEREKAAPDLKLLASLLRSKIDLPEEIRHWLADLMDPEAASTFQFKKLSRRKRGAGPGAKIYSDVGRIIREKIWRGEQRKNAINDAAKEYGISVSGAGRTLASYDEAEEIRHRINQEAWAEQDEREIEEARKLQDEKDSK